MFEVGKFYEISMHDMFNGVGQSVHKVVAVEGPLIKLDRAPLGPGGEMIVNTSAPQFVSARLLSDEEMGDREAWSDALQRGVLNSDE